MNSVINEVAALRKDMDALNEKLDRLLATQTKTAELMDDLRPAAKDAMMLATGRLQAIKERGWFDFGKALVEVADQVVEGYSAEDVRELGQNVVGILGTVRALTQPEIMRIAGEAAGALQEADAAEPTGLLGMLKRSQDDEVRKGMAVALELLRHIGRAASTVQSDAKARRRRRMAAMLGPSRSLPAKAAQPEPKAAAPKPAAARAAALSVPGVDLDGDGFLADRGSWSEEVAGKIAAALGIELTEEHWKVVNWIRADFAETGAAPNVRRIAMGSGVPVKELYALFVKAPAMTAARIAGVSKPVGCI